MRIKKGSHVEVWTHETASPVGAWRGGEVQWGNGHSYILRWHDGAPDSGRISRKIVRPRPPPAPVPGDLDAGDMVEVFDEDDYLWKCAEVVRAGGDGGGEFRVKIVGSAKVLMVPPHRLRVRQVLRDDDVWVVLHKDNQIAVASSMPLRANGGRIGIGEGNGGLKPVAPGFKLFNQKRSLCMLDAKMIGNGMRFEDNSKRLCVKEEPRLEIEVIEVHPNVCLDKQDEMSSEDCDVVGTGSNSNDEHHHHHQQHKEEEEDSDDDSESDSSSGGSSSSSDSRTRSGDAGDRPASPASRPRDVQKVDQPRDRKRDHCDDTAESREIVGANQNDEKWTVVAPQGQIHRLEMEAYTALTKAFHASGVALSWEKAELLTDLRVHLHISNDEHLQVINEVLNRKGRFRRPGNF
ncbi:uncharacterized protein LOC133909978 [Phragmites australis]|uniref:uncharacterized protein LOC133909978 n=1 Tax=Phragmites australis TaxID=29695 RepID=UPI002D785AC8|nr:uncharacterized protein LOC133909978 [Phragmites australis]